MSKVINGHVIYPGADLRDASLTDAGLREVDLYGADLRDADLQGANLRDANLWAANLRGADLWGADLRDANLWGANLRDASLTDADLREADLQGADLRDADLQGADLRDANLWGANLRDASLTDADLREADLRDADLRRADLRDADLQGANLPDYQRLPSHGPAIAWKECEEHVVKLRIPADAERVSSLVGPKCRVEYAEVVAVLGEDGSPSDDEVAHSRWTDEEFVYREGETVYPDDWNNDIRVQCTHGIHIYPTKGEVVSDE